MPSLEVPGTDATMLWETQLSQCWFPALLAADDLGVISSVADAPASADDLAVRLSLNPRPLGAVLAMLTSLGYFQVRGGRYHLANAAAPYVLADSPLYWGGVFATSRPNNALFQRLRQVLLTADPDDPMPRAEAAGERRSNADGWATGDLPIEQARSSARYMQSKFAAIAVSLARSADFSKARRLLDVGGCSGCYSIALAQHNPQLTCTVMDLPTVCGVCEEYIRASGAGDRVGTVAADMFRQEWPAGYDAVLLSNVLHDWRPDTCAQIVKSAYAALPSGGTVNIHEMLIDDEGTGPRIAAAFALLMALGTQGQQFTFRELAQMLSDAGFVDIECFSTSAMYSLVRGHKP